MERPGSIAHRATEAMLAWPDEPTGWTRRSRDGKIERPQRADSEA